MKLSMRVKLVSVLAVCAVFFAGSAWAQTAGEVATIIDGYFGSTAASVAGNIITVTGSKTGVTSTLALGDITGLTIDWKADLTGEGGQIISDGSRGIITFTNGEFKITDGTIQISSSRNEDVEIDAINASGAPNITLAGGKLKSGRARSIGIAMDRGTVNGTLTIESGEIDVPRGQAILADGTVKIDITAPDPNAVINGIVCVGGDSVTDTATITAYGHTITVGTTKNVFSDFENETDHLAIYSVWKGATWDIEGVSSDMTVIPNVDILNMKVESGGTLNFKNTDMKFKGSLEILPGGEINLDEKSRLIVVGGIAINGGTINIHGTLTNLDKVVNNSTINNYSGNTLDNQRNLTNNGTINNKSTGKITNTGTITNTNGTINNEGIFQSVQTKEKMGGTVNGEVQPLNSGSGGGGCNAGFGLFGLLAAGFVALKYRKA